MIDSELSIGLNGRYNSNERKELYRNQVVVMAAWTKREWDIARNLANKLYGSDSKNNIISIDNVIAAAQIILDMSKCEVPYAETFGTRRSLRTDSELRNRTITQNRFFRQLVNQLIIKVSDHQIRYFWNYGDDEVDITERVNTLTEFPENPSASLYRYPALFSRAGVKIDRLICDYKSDRDNGTCTTPLVVIGGTPGQFPNSDHVISINGCMPIGPSHLKRSDTVIDSSKDINLLKLGVYRSIIAKAQQKEQFRFLEQCLKEGTITTIDEIDLHNNWPTHPLINRLRNGIDYWLREAINRCDAFVDPQDLEHQVLFRSTTYSPRELFANGDRLVDYLALSGAYEDWRKITSVDPSFIQQLELHEDLVKEIIDEQLVIILNRLSTLPLPLEKLFNKRYFGSLGQPVFNFDENQRSVLVWQKGASGRRELFALHPADCNKRVRVEFKTVSPDIAYEITYRLHYIHTPRLKGDSFGLFFEGDEYPLAIETTESTRYSRNYKRNALVLNGFNPDHGLELTRLYTLPGSPRNVISIMDGLVRQYYRDCDPKVEVICTTVMPSYAKSRSTTLAGGIDKPYLIKRGGHTFQEKRIGNISVFEHVTSRRYDKANTVTIQTNPEFPLLPVVEVLNPVNSRSYTESELVKGRVLVHN